MHSGSSTCLTCFEEAADTKHSDDTQHGCEGAEFDQLSGCMAKLVPGMSVQIQAPKMPLQQQLTMLNMNSP